MDESDRLSIDELRDPRTGELVTTAARYRSGPAARVIDYSAFDTQAPLACYSCGWSGTAGDGASEYHSALFDVSCPTCDTMLLIVSY